MKINVLQLISSTGLFGAEKVVMELLKELNRDPFKLYFGVIENSSGAYLAVAEEARKYIQGVTVFPCKGKFDLRTIITLRNFMESNNIHVIHSHGYKTNLYSLIASLLKKKFLSPRVTTGWARITN